MSHRIKVSNRTLLIPIVVVSLIAASSMFGSGSRRSAVRIGYVEHTEKDSWSADYARLSGTMRRTLRLGDVRESLYIETVTKEGELSIKITDEADRVLLDEENMGTASFDVEGSGTLDVLIRADHHKGGFRIERGTPAQSA